VQHPRYDYPLFAPPNPSLSTVDHAIGLHASSLVRDGGTLQIGIGELGDSVCYALLLRHQQNGAYRDILEQLPRGDGLANSCEPFGEGLFASTEMLVDEMLELYRAGILRRRVYDWLPLQRVRNAYLTSDRYTSSILEQLLAHGVGPKITADEFDRMRRYGVFRQDTQYRDGRIRCGSGPWIEGDLSQPDLRQQLAAECLGLELRNGKLVHAGFFVGPRNLYAALGALPESERELIDMRGVGYINQLDGPEYDLKVAQRAHARCINTTMMVTLLGAAVSDGLADGRVVSGVGGQYNFVAMAHALPSARSILCVRATRTKNGVVSSNIVLSYGHTTIPRHLRDIVITEYGVADLRGKTDRECVAAMLAVSDSRFQPELLRAAIANRKIEPTYQIPESQRANTPARLADAFAPFRTRGLFSEYPFGTDLTPDEIRIAGALRALQQSTATTGAKVRLALAVLMQRTTGGDLPYLTRLGLQKPANFREHWQAKLVSFALAQFSSG
jgi:hypothetical protein